jgi:CsoR family transcriptional regulator, copper-sensing transcriptional repressor
MMSSSQTKDVLNRLARIKGHVASIHEMVEADRSSSELILQIVAVRSALNKVAQIILMAQLEQFQINADSGSNYETELANFRKALDLII